ncbi:MAG: hypothetical protein KBC15_00355 [Candidatus Levybacteria bacterium]|nr:hypothetical protein [Candidatus Levybacteria bacterium]
MAKETGGVDHSQDPTFMGKRIEDPALDNAGWKALALTTEAAAKLRLTKVEGALPEEGPGLVFSNHVNFLDIFILPWVATRTADRSLRIVSKDVLIHPEIEEDRRVLIRTGKITEDEVLANDGQIHPYDDQDSDASDGPKTPSLIKRTAGNLLNYAGNPILIHRGELGSEFVQEVRETLDSGQLVGMFAQETRTPQNDISNVMPGPAILLKRYFPDTDAYVTTVAHQGQPLRRPQVRISEPFTYKQLSPKGDMTIKGLQGYIKDTMYKQLVKDVPDLKR